MTTIAVNKKSMAADSQFTHQNLITRGDKIFKLGDDIIGYCGDVESGTSFIDWKKGGEKPAELEEDFEAFVLSKSGQITWYGSKMIALPIKEKFTAIGSGSHLAIGAMYAGLSPEEAVKIACKVDTFSCLPVKVFDIK